MSWRLSPAPFDDFYTHLQVKLSSTLCTKSYLPQENFQNVTLGPYIIYHWPLGILNMGYHGI